MKNPRVPNRPPRDPNDVHPSFLQHALGIFQELARKAPASNYISYNFGNAYSEIAAAHVAWASKPSLTLDAQREHWREARDWYRKGLDVWLELQRQGKLGGDEIGEPDRLPKEIAKCDKSIIRLQSLGDRVSKQ